MSSIKKLSLVLSMVWKASKTYFTVLILNSFVFSGQIMANVILPKFLIDELGGEKDIKRLVWFVMAIVLSNVLFAFLKKLFSRLLDVEQERIS